MEVIIMDLIFWTIFPSIGQTFQWTANDKQIWETHGANIFTWPLLALVLFLQRLNQRINQILVSSLSTSGIGMWKLHSVNRKTTKLQCDKFLISQIGLNETASGSEDSLTSILYISRLVKQFNALFNWKLVSFDQAWCERCWKIQVN